MDPDVLAVEYMNDTAVFRHVEAIAIQQDQWIPFLAEFTKTYRGAHAVLRIVAPNTDVAYRVEAEDRPFDGVSADIKDREHAVWIAFGSGPHDHLTHGVHNAVAIQILHPESNKGPVLEVEAADGTRTILELNASEEYRLPPR